MRRTRFVLQKMRDTFMFDEERIIKLRRSLTIFLFENAQSLTIAKNKRARKKCFADKSSTPKGLLAKSPFIGPDSDLMESPRGIRHFNADTRRYHGKAERHGLLSRRNPGGGNLIPWAGSHFRHDMVLHVTNTRISYRSATILFGCNRKSLIQDPSKPALQPNRQQKRTMEEPDVTNGRQKRHKARQNRYRIW